MKIAIRVKAPNDDAGNPRRGWQVYEITEGQRYGKYLGYVDEGYNDRALREAYQGEHVAEIAVIPVSATFIREARKDQAVREHKAKMRREAVV